MTEQFRFVMINLNFAGKQTMSDKMQSYYKEEAFKDMNYNYRKEIKETSWR